MGLRRVGEERFGGGRERERSVLLVEADQGQAVVQEVAAVLLAGPLIFANLMMNLVFGIVARTVPQMNVLMVSFVVNIGMGLILFLGITEEFFHVSFDFYVKSLGEWFQFLSP